MPEPAIDASCQAPALIETGIEKQGDTTGANNSIKPTTSDCDYADSESSDHVYRWVPSETGEYRISTFGSSFDAVVAVFNACNLNAESIACDDLSGPSLTAEISAFQANAGETYFVAVTGYNTDDFGEYVLRITQATGDESGGCTQNSDCESGQTCRASVCVDRLNPIEDICDEVTDGGINFFDGETLGQVRLSPDVDTLVSCSAQSEGGDAMIRWRPDYSGTYTVRVEMPTSVLGTPAVAVGVYEGCSRSGGAFLRCIDEWNYLSYESFELVVDTSSVDEYDFLISAQRPELEGELIFSVACLRGECADVLLDSSCDADTACAANQACVAGRCEAITSGGMSGVAGFVGGGMSGDDGLGGTGGESSGDGTDAAGVSGSGGLGGDGGVSGAGGMSGAGDAGDSGIGGNPVGGDAGDSGIGGNPVGGDAGDSVGGSDSDGGTPVGGTPAGGNAGASGIAGDSADGGFGGSSTGGNSTDGDAGDSDNGGDGGAPIGGDAGNSIDGDGGTSGASADGEGGDSAIAGASAGGESGDSATAGASAGGEGGDSATAGNAAGGNEGDSDTDGGGGAQSAGAGGNSADGDAGHAVDGGTGGDPAGGSAGDAVGGHNDDAGHSGDGGDMGESLGGDGGEPVAGDTGDGGEAGDLSGGDGGESGSPMAGDGSAGTGGSAADSCENVGICSATGYCDDTARPECNLSGDPNLAACHDFDAPSTTKPEAYVRCCGQLVQCDVDQWCEPMDQPDCWLGETPRCYSRANAIYAYVCDGFDAGSGGDGGMSGSGGADGLAGDAGDANNGIFDNAPCNQTDVGCPLIEFVAVPGGEFDMGDESNPDFKPVHRVTLPTYSLSRSEVTIGQYRVCVDAQVCTAPNNDWSATPGERESHPVRFVNWYQARAFAEFVGARLPSEAEWEYAAREGGETQYFVWGENLPTCENELLNFNDCLNDTAPVCSFPNGHTDEGICDLHGNVSEWLEDDYHYGYDGAPTDGSAWINSGARAQHRMHRGGAWCDGVSSVRAFDRSHDHPNRASGDTDGDLGFRVARDGGIGESDEPTPSLCLRGLFFDGDNDHINLYSPPVYQYLLSEDFTIEGWIKLTPNMIGRKRPVFYWGDNIGSLANNYISLIVNGANRVGFDIRSIGADGDIRSRSVFSNMMLEDDVWYHIAAVRSVGEAMRIYIDGQASGNQVDSGDPVNFGAFVRRAYVGNNLEGIYPNSPEQNHGFRGVIARVGFWQRALGSDVLTQLSTPAEVQTPEVEDRVVFFPLDEGVGGTISGTSTNATHHNTQWASEMCIE